MTTNDISIDWGMVMDVLLKKERITPVSPEIIQASARESVKKAQALARSKTLIVQKKISSFTPDSIKLDSYSKLSGAALSSYMTGADHVYIFLVTIGSSLEDEASRLMKIGETLSGYMLDRAASIAVENLAEALELKIRKDYEGKEKSVSMRMSPGYCNWPIKEQVELDWLLDYSKIGVRLTENCMMIPRKSISGLIGIGAKGHFVRKKSQCMACNKKDCDYRRI